MGKRNEAAMLFLIHVFEQSYSSDDSTSQQLAYQQKRAYINTRQRSYLAFYALELFMEVGHKCSSQQL